MLGSWYVLRSMRVSYSETKFQYGLKVLYAEYIKDLKILLIAKIYLLCCNVFIRIHSVGFIIKGNSNMILRSQCGI